MSNTLELTFKLTNNKTKSISITNPIMNPTRDKVEPVMKKLLALNLYGGDGVDMASIKGAKVRQTEVVFDAED
ncbi:MAG: DUF2922 domain-containing protein [Acidaminococcus sp.]|jgi:hypothetical protein|nr:DUF2922 domain-containing protein [Acidaminococcus sp.]MCH3950785.1 DUF2922 domain-containing protein [Acidaminococcus sp.]MCI2101009.1 DUF2922 domain-containing protein [Acidaminococcus sp.]